MHFDDGCRLMADGAALTVVQVDEKSPCPIKQFTPAPPPDLELAEPDDIIGLRKFAELVGVKLASIQGAIDSGRITAVIQTRNGRQLIKDEALEQWNATRTAGNSNRFGELAGDNELALQPEPVLTPGGLKTQLESDLLRIRIESEQQKLDVSKGILHKAEDLQMLWEGAQGVFRSRILAIAAKVAPRIAALPKSHHYEIEEIINAECCDALTELSKLDFLELSRGIEDDTTENN